MADVARPQNGCSGQSSEHLREIQPHSTEILNEYRHKRQLGIRVGFGSFVHDFLLFFIERGEVPSAAANKGIQRLLCALI